MADFRKALEAGTPLLFDGAMGTELYKRGIFINRCFEEASLANRDIVLALHREYAAAGADVLSTNSWGAGRYKLKGHNLQDRVREINVEAAKLAREAAGGALLVAGSVGPLGARLEPLGPMRARDAYDAYLEQIGGLAEGGVDAILLETFVELDDIRQAIAAAKAAAPGLPILSCLTIDLSGRLPLGGSLEEAVPLLVEWGSDAVGLNCSVGPGPMLTAIRKMRRATDRPLIVQPNAGLPKEVEGRSIYMATPEYFAEYAKRFLQEGVQFVGGCCGTSPDHIRAMAQAMRQGKAMLRVEPGGAEAPPEARREAPREAPRVPFAEKSAWSRKIAAGERVFTVELLPPSGISAAKLLESAALLKTAGVDAINIPDGPRASSRMSAIIGAILVEQRVGIETILHYTCRDRNLIGMQADVLGAHAIGLRNMLLVTGDPPKLGGYPEATGVFDADSIGLARMVRALNGGIDLGGRTIGEPTSISIGVGVNPIHPDFDYEMGRFRRKVEAGAEWAITQPVFELRSVERFLAFIAKEGFAIPVILGIWPLASLRNAQFMRNEVPGILIPDEVMERMAGAESPEAARDEGVAIAREMRDAIIGEVQGIQVSAPFGRIEPALQVLASSRSSSGMTS
jgi:methionine synthase I (cobalamin-dependent)/5,10-methylenetetrahydrofolate reductase